MISTDKVLMEDLTAVMGEVFKDSPLDPTVRHCCFVRHSAFFCFAPPHVCFVVILLLWLLPGYLRAVPTQHSNAWIRVS